MSEGGNYSGRGWHGGQKQVQAAETSRSEKDGATKKKEKLWPEHEKGPERLLVCLVER